MGLTTRTIRDLEQVTGEFLDTLGLSAANRQIIAAVMGADDLTIQTLTERADKAEALLKRCRPFVLRALNGVNVPHAQDKIDAEALWPLLRRFGDR